MRIELNEQQKKNQAAFREFVNEEIIPNADLYDQEERIPPDLIKKMARRGYFGATIPVEYGGCGMDMISYGLLNEELGRGCASVRALVMLQNMIAHTILRWGSRHQKEYWLQRIASGEVIAAFALTEPNVGSDATNVETLVKHTRDSFVIQGRKKWITFGQIADLFLAFGQCDGKLVAFLLEKDTEGLSIEPIYGMLGARASMLAELQLTGCQIPKENIVAEMGFGLVPVGVYALNFGRYSVAWGCVGIMQACFEACLRHTSIRKQFGVCIKEHQLIQKMITDMIVNLKAARLLCYQAGYAREVEQPNFIMETLVAKYFASTMAVRVANDAVQIHGALGCSNTHAVQRYLRDAKIMEIIEGTTQIHQIKIAEYAYQTYGDIQ